MTLAGNLKRTLILGERGLPLPRLELMPYHPQTLERWRAEGLPATLQTQNDLHRHFGLDPLEFFFLWPDIDGTGCREKIATPEDFAQACAGLYDLEKVRRRLPEYTALRERMREQNGVLWVPLHGFFWHPRELFGVAEHLMMFYDEPELMHDINHRLLEFNLEAVRLLSGAGAPDVICVSEDMAYKAGSMVSGEMFAEFLAPYHRPLAAEIKKEDCVAAVDTDGEISGVIPWFADCGYHCINPMERQTGMDLMALRGANPAMAFMGGYNKLVMNKGPAAIDAEWASLDLLFDRGRFLPAVDHQTPPEVSLENYRHYLAASEAFFRRAPTPAEGEM
jgi:hypothetical protein